MNSINLVRHSMYLQAAPAKRPAQNPIQLIAQKKLPKKDDVRESMTWTRLAVVAIGSLAIGLVAAAVFQHLNTPQNPGPNPTDPNPIDPQRKPTAFNAQPKPEAFIPQPKPAPTSPFDQFKEKMEEVLKAPVVVGDELSDLEIQQIKDGQRIIGGTTGDKWTYHRGGLEAVAASAGLRKIPAHERAALEKLSENERAKALQKYVDAECADWGISGCKWNEASLTPIMKTELLVWSRDALIKQYCAFMITSGSQFFSSDSDKILVERLRSMRDETKPICNNAVKNLFQDVAIPTIEKQYRQLCEKKAGRTLPEIVETERNVIQNACKNPSAKECSDKCESGRTNLSKFLIDAEELVKTDFPIWRSSYLQAVVMGARKDLSEEINQINLGCPCK